MRAPSKFVVWPRSNRYFVEMLRPDGQRRQIATYRTENDAVAMLRDLQNRQDARLAVIASRDASRLNLR